MSGKYASESEDLMAGISFKKNEFNSVILCNVVFIRISAISIFLITRNLSGVNG